MRHWVVRAKEARRRRCSEGEVGETCSMFAVKRYVLGERAGWKPEAEIEARHQLYGTYVAVDRAVTAIEVGATPVY